MVIDFHVEVINLIKADPEASVISFGQENPVGGQRLGFGHPIHKIEFLYIHIWYLYVLINIQ